MRKKIAIFATVLAAAMVVSANETTADMAIAAAQNWSAANVNSFAPSGDALSAVAERDSDGTLLWWVVRFSDGGAVIVAPDTRIEPVMSVLPVYNGPIPEGHPLRAMLMHDMRNRLKVLGKEAPASSGAGMRLRAGGNAAAALPKAVAASAAEAKAKWADLAPIGQRLKVQPIDDSDGRTMPAYILGICPGFEVGGVYTHWNQSESEYSLESTTEHWCYNYHTPRHAVCGCVATAGAAVMQYLGNNGPTYNVTNQCSWGEELDGNPYRYIGDFTMIGATNKYDWNILPANLGGTNAVVRGGIDGTYMTTEQVDLLGRATYDMGVGVTMAWALDGEGSGSKVSFLADAFRLYYGLKDSRAVISETGGFWHDANNKLIYSQVRNGVPVPLGIYSSSSGGHAVLAIGYGLDKAGTSYTRIFMGWSGQQDAWYCLPNIAEFELVTQIVTMVNPDNTKSVPVVGRVVTESGKGAAFVKVDVKGDGGAVITNAITDANGYWAVRINEEGLALNNAPEVVYEETTTNLYLVTDVAGTNAVHEALEAAGGDGGLVYFESAPDDVEVGGTVINDSYSCQIKVFETNGWDDVANTNFVGIISNAVVKTLRYALNVSCPNATSVDTGVGAFAFDNDRAYRPRDPKLEYDERPLTFSIPDDVILTVSDDSVVTAFPGTENPYNVITNALNAGKMIFMLAGRPGSEDYDKIISYISDPANVAEFNTNYVLYVIEPEKDPYNLNNGYNLGNGDPSFGVFDPSVFNATSDERWGFYNGRLAYFDVTNGVTDADIRGVMDSAYTSYVKLHSNITITVDPGMDGVATNGFEVTPEVLDWMGGQPISGYGTFTDCFTNGQTVAFTAPSVVTNGNYAMAASGWVLYNTDEEDEIKEFYDIWIEVAEYAAEYGSPEIKNLYWTYFYGEQYPEPFAPPASAELMWVTNDVDTVCRCETNCVVDANWTVLWRWNVKEVRISATAENGKVKMKRGGDTTAVDFPAEGIWVEYGDDDDDKITFIAESSVTTARFLYWNGLPREMNRFLPEISLMPTNSYSITARFTTDRSYYKVSYSCDPSDVNPEITAVENGTKTNMFSDAKSLTMQAGSLKLTAPESVTNIVDDVTNVLYCVGWTGTGCIEACGNTNFWEGVVTNESSITWLWRETAGDNPYFNDNITFSVSVGDDAPENGAFDPAPNSYTHTYTNGQTVVCTATSGVTNETETAAYEVVCDGWTLTDDYSGEEVKSGDGSTAEITLEKDASWTLKWKWKVNELVRIKIVAEQSTGRKSETTTKDVTDALYSKGTVVEIPFTPDKQIYVFDCLDGEDANGCEFVGCNYSSGYTFIVPADKNRSFTAKFKAVEWSYANLSVASVSTTNMTDGTFVEWGTIDPQGYTNEERMVSGGNVSFTMSGDSVTNIVDDVTNVWVCTGWTLIATSLAKDATTVGSSFDLASASTITSGTGIKAAFEFTQNSTLLWIWREQSAIPTRSALKTPLKGQGDTTPITVGGNKTTAQIANTSRGWWYGLYYKNLLVDPSWLLVPGKKELAENDDQIITFEVDWNSSEPQKFFTVIPTENEPTDDQPPPEEP